MSSSIRKIVETHSLLNITGELDSIRETLVKLGKVTEAQVVDNIYEKLVAEIDLDAIKLAKKMTVPQKQKMRRKMKMHRPYQKKWICCKRPTLRTIIGGKRVWMSTCQVRMLSGPNRGKTQAMTRIVGRNTKKKPTQLTFMVRGTKQRVKWC